MKLVNIRSFLLLYSYTNRLHYISQKFSHPSVPMNTNSIMFMQDVTPLLMVCSRSRRLLILGKKYWLAVLNVELLLKVFKAHVI